VLHWVKILILKYGIVGIINPNPIMSYYTKIYSGTPIMVLSIKQRLLDKNIIPVIKDIQESAKLAGFGSVYGNIQDVFVHNDELARAKKTINDLK
tara:strand:- start:611 stop:895 length:285 start_codon:yes stop_codon:yes gene_type:complete